MHKLVPEIFITLYKEQVCAFCWFGRELDIGFFLNEVANKCINM